MVESGVCVSVAVKGVLEGFSDTPNVNVGFGVKVIECPFSVQLMLNKNKITTNTFFIFSPSFLGYYGYPKCKVWF